jgi:hypothetical protein
VSAEATIRRGVRNARYAAIPNHVFEDSRLSMEARWLLSYLLSKPDNWTVVIGDIIRKGNCGRDKARKMIAELVEFGYAEREQTRDDGKFGSSVLVIFDEPSVGIHSGIQSERSSVAFLPQTDLPATAEPAPVSPSPVKSALSNNLDLPNTESYQERDGACAGSDEDPKKVEKAFKAWYPTWPTYLSDSQDAALAAWLLLSADDRATCIERTPAFLAAVKANKGKTTYASVYLKGKAWEKLDDPKSDVAPTIAHNPFSRAWMARRFAELLKPAATVMPSPSQFQQQQLRAGGDAAEAVRIDRLQKYGWPRVNTMHQRAEMAQGVTVAPSLVSLSEGFQSCKRDSELARRWEAYHASQGWPWLPMPKGIEWLYFPAGEPDEAISELGAAIAREQGNDDAG